MAVPGGDTALQNAGNKVGKVSDAVILDALLKAGFNQSEAVTMLAVSLAESGGNSNAHNPRGEDSRGLFQINIGPGANTDLANMDLYDPYENAKAAKIVYDRQGLSAWTVTHGNQNARYLQFENRARAAGQTAGFMTFTPNFAGTSGYGGGKVSAVGDASSMVAPFTDMGTGEGAYETEQQMDDAWAIAQDMLAEYGLESLFDTVYELITTGRSTETAMQLIRTSEEYKARFKGMEERIANGYKAITPERYLELESNYRSMMNQAGFDPEFVGEDFSAFIANDVNENEFGDRIDLALEAAESADPLILDELRDRYGIGVDSNADLAMYFLDPERAVTLLEARTQLGVATLGAASAAVLGGSLETNTAEKLYRRGYSGRELGERLKGQAGFRQRLVGEQKRSKTGGPLSSTELAAAEFGLDSESVAMVKNLTAQRRQRGVSTSGAALTSSGVTGFGRAT